MEGICKERVEGRQEKAVEVNSNGREMEKGSKERWRESNDKLQREIEDATEGRE